MKLQAKHIERDGSGSVSLVPLEPEDLWHAYNLISIGDHVTATTIRYEVFPPSMPAQ
jgi:protein pelota